MMHSSGCPGSQLMGWDHAEPSSTHHVLLPRWATLHHLAWTLVGTCLQLQQTAFTWDLALSSSHPHNPGLISMLPSLGASKGNCICLLHPTTMSQSGASWFFCCPLFCMALSRGASPGEGSSSHWPWQGAGREVTAKTWRRTCG